MCSLRCKWYLIMYELLIFLFFSRKSVASNQADQSGPGVLQQMLDALSTNLGLEGGTLDQKIAQLDAAPNKSQGDILMMRQLKFLTGIPKNMQPYYDSIVQLCVSMSDITKHTTVKSLFDTLAVQGDQASQRLPLLFVDEGSLVLFCASALWEMEAEVRPYAVDGDVLDNILPAVGFFHQYEIDCFYDEDDDDISLCVMWKENGDASSLVTFLQTLVADATKSIDLTGGHLVHLNGKESTRGHMIQSAEQVATLRGKYHKFVFNRLVFSGLDPVAWCGVAQQLQFNKCKFEDGAADHLFDAAMNYPALSLVFAEDYPFTHEESFKLLSKVDFENAPTLVFEGDDAACSFMGAARVSAFLTEIAAEVIGSNFDPKSWLKLKSFDIYGKGNAALGAIMKNAVKIVFKRIGSAQRFEEKKDDILKNFSKKVAKIEWPYQVDTTQDLADDLIQFVRLCTFDNSGPGATQEMEDLRDQHDADYGKKAAKAAQPPTRTAAVLENFPNNWGDTFAKKDGVWKCEGCSCHNVPKEKTICPSCQTPKPDGDTATVTGPSNVETNEGSTAASQGGFSFPTGTAAGGNKEAPVSTGFSFQPNTSMAAAQGGFLFPTGTATNNAPAVVGGGFLFSANAATADTVPIDTVGESKEEDTEEAPVSTGAPAASTEESKNGTGSDGQEASSQQEPESPVAPREATPPRRRGIRQRNAVDRFTPK